MHPSTILDRRRRGPSERHRGSQCALRRPSVPNLPIPSLIHHSLTPQADASSPAAKRMKTEHRDDGESMTQTPPSASAQPSNEQQTFPSSQCCQPPRSCVAGPAAVGSVGGQSYSKPTQSGVGGLLVPCRFIIRAWRFPCCHKVALCLTKPSTFPSPASLSSSGALFGGGGSSSAHGAAAAAPVSGCQPESSSTPKKPLNWLSQHVKSQSRRATVALRCTS